MPVPPHNAPARHRRELHWARVVIFVALLGAHVLGVVFIATQRNAGSQTADDGFSTTVFFDEKNEWRKSVRAMELHARSGSEGVSKQEISQVKAPPESPVPSTPPAAVEWAWEVERAAAHRIESEEEARLRGPSPLAGLVPSVGAEKFRSPRPQFGWDYAHIHRVEEIPDGGLIVNLNDRCTIVVKFPMLVGACKIGKIEARGDLFSHMRDPRD